MRVVCEICIAENFYWIRVLRGVGIYIKIIRGILVRSPAVAIHGKSEVFARMAVGAYPYGVIPKTAFANYNFSDWGAYPDIFV